MSAHGFDPEIVQDFLTEAGELLERLDRDLVTLEGSAALNDPEALNKVFRALHTIKGSASFLALTGVVEVAHAAEGALNAARNGAVRIDRGVMDLLLCAVDTLRRQFDDLREGRELIMADAALVSGLMALAEGRGADLNAGPAAGTVPSGQRSANGADSGVLAGDRERPLVLSGSKGELLDFFIADVDASVTRLDALLGAVRQTRDAAPALELLASLAKTAAFFEFDTMNRVVALVDSTLAPACELEDAAFSGAIDRLKACAAMLREQCSGLRDRKVIEHDLAPMEAELARVLSGDTGEVPVAMPAGGLVEQGSAKADAAADGKGPGAGEAHAGVEQTVRVEVSRLESLLSLVGELVLQKDELGAIARRAVAGQTDLEQLGESLTRATENLDRVTGEIQVAVMRAQMQPLEKLFGRYPRLIRDLARKTGKQIQMKIVGGETEVDKSVIEELADPLVHLLRNSVDHGLETPAERAASGKGEMGEITLRASHGGSHVLIQIIDDGRGLSRVKIGERAVERGLVTEAQLGALADRDVWNFIFAPGFSTAERVTDLSGRGVGMDVVRTNIEKMKGSIELFSAAGKGTTISIMIPVTVAI